MSKLPVWAIIPASGIGERMQSDLPKQYLKLIDKTIIEHTLDRILSHDSIEGAIVVLNLADKHWAKLNYTSLKPVITTTGGKQRQHSVYNGLEALGSHIKQDCYALVHDAVRPLVSHQNMSDLIRTAEQYNDGALLAVPVTDTLKQRDDEGNICQTVTATGLWRAFTPQIFRSSLLSTALEHVRENQRDITDEASAVEAIGLKPKLLLGSAENIKITLPEDLILARQIWIGQLNASLWF